MPGFDPIPHIGLPFYEATGDQLQYWALGINDRSFDRICVSTDGLNWTTWRTFTSSDPIPHYHTIFRDSLGRTYISGIGRPPDERTGLFRLTVNPGQSPSDAQFERVMAYETQVNRPPYVLVCVRPWSIIEDSQGSLYAAESGDTNWGTLWRIPRDGTPYVVFKSDKASIKFVGGSTKAHMWSPISWMRHIHGIALSSDENVYFVVGDGGNEPTLSLARGLWIFDPHRNTIDLTVPGQPYGNPPGGQPGVFWQEDWSTQWTDVAFTTSDEMYLPADTVGANCEIWQYRWSTHYAKVASLNPPFVGEELTNAKYVLRPVNENEAWFTLPEDDNWNNAATGFYRMTRGSVNDGANWSKTKVVDRLDDNLHITELAADCYRRIPAKAPYVFFLAWDWLDSWQAGDRYPQSCVMFRVARTAAPAAAV